MIALWLAAVALAAQVQLEVDAPEVREGQTVGLTLTVVDAVAASAPLLSAPEGLDIRFQSKSVQRTIINFQSVTTITFHYELTALEPGDFTIPPVEVQTTSVTLKTQPVRILVSPRAPTAEGLVGDIGVATVWVGQVLVYHLHFETLKSLLSGRWSFQPPDGFATEPSVEPLTNEYRSEQDGQPLTVEELYYPLRASAPGRVKGGGGVLRVQFSVPRARNGRRPIDVFDRFSDLREEIFSAKPLEIDVEPLPTADRPVDFTGLVGRFTVSAKPSATEVEVGDTITLEVAIEGDGPIGGVTLPAVGGTGFRVYDDQPVATASLEGGHYRARAVFKRAIVPEQPGDLEIPGVSISWFDPVAGTWDRATTEPLSLHVGGAAGVADVVSFDAGGPRTVDALGEDVLPVRTDVSIRRPLSGLWGALLLVPGSAALFAQGASLLRRRPKAEATRRMEFEDLPSEPEARLAGLERIVRERVGARLGISPDAVRREDAAGLGAEAVWRALETARYRGVAAGLPEAEVRAFAETLS